jgi:glycerophosphoryl diester phosphodiesterase
VHAPTLAPEVVAHRGASARRAEHTAAAYDLALAQGADALELDVRATADRALMVVHDPTLQRTAGWPHQVAGVTLAEIRASCGERAPLTLDDVLARYGARTRYLIELKDPDPAWEHLVADAVARHRLHDRATIQSFDAAALRRVHDRAPWITCAPLVMLRRGPRTLDRFASFASGVGVWHRQIDAGFVATAHARGLAVRAWTVNEPAAIRRVVALGVDGVITDAPDVAARLTRPAVSPALAPAA